MQSLFFETPQILCCIFLSKETPTSSVPLLSFIRTHIKSTFSSSLITFLLLLHCSCCHLGRTVLAFLCIHHSLSPKGSCGKTIMRTVSLSSEWQEGNIMAFSNGFYIMWPVRHKSFYIMRTVTRVSIYIMRNDAMNAMRTVVSRVVALYGSRVTPWRRHRKKQTSQNGPPPHTPPPPSDHKK